MGRPGPLLVRGRPTTFRRGTVQGAGARERLHSHLSIPVAWRDGGDHAKCSESVIEIDGLAGSGELWSDGDVTGDAAAARDVQGNSASWCRANSLPPTGSASMWKMRQGLQNVRFTELSAGCADRMSPGRRRIWP